MTYLFNACFVRPGRLRPPPPNRFLPRRAFVSEGDASMSVSGFFSSLLLLSSEASATDARKIAARSTMIMANISHRLIVHVWFALVLIWGKIYFGFITCATG